MSSYIVKINNKWLDIGTFIGIYIRPLDMLLQNLDPGSVASCRYVASANFGKLFLKINCDMSFVMPL